MSWQSFSKALVISLLASSGALTASPAHAEVRRTGDWGDDPQVTLDFDQLPRFVAVRRLAAAAGWSLMSTVPPGEPIDVHVRDVRASKVLDLLLSDGVYLAKRDGSLIVLSPMAPGEAAPAAPAKPAAPPAPPAAPEPPEPPAMPEAPDPPDPPDADEMAEHGEHGSDREVFGGNLRVEKGEVVSDVSVFGGDADVWGTVRGDLVVTGGNVRVHTGARVMGDVTGMGGDVTIEDHARVDGSVSTVGGVLRRGKTAEIHGDIKVDDREHAKRRAAQREQEERPSFLRDAASNAVDTVTSAALLFVIGVVLLSLATGRMEKLKVELASRPMRSFAVGVVALLCWLGLTIALCITVVGIPLAILGVFGGVLAVFVGLSATLETIGSALLGHKTRNPYVHLAFGCGLFLVLGAIPWVGAVVKLVVLLAGIGSVTVTRGAGLFPAKNKATGSPYRDVSAAL